MTFLTSPYEQGVRKQQSSKLLQDENAQIHLVSDLRVLQAGDVGFFFRWKEKGYMEERVSPSPGYLVRKQERSETSKVHFILLGHSYSFGCLN